MSNLATRVLVALVGIPAIVAITLAGGWWFFLFVMAVGLLALREFYALASAKGAHPQTMAGYILSVLLGTVFTFDRFRFSILAFLDARGISVPFPTMFQWFLILVLLFAPFLAAVELFRNRGSALLNLGSTFLGTLYVSLCLGCLVGLRELFIPVDFPVGLHFPGTGPSVPADVVAQVYRWGGGTVLTVFVSIWMCDSVAYFAGRAFGKHPLFERVSPKKTWEGAVAGFVAAVLTFLLAQRLVLPYLTVGQAIVCGVVVGLFGQIGDLFESLLKRDAGVKDSSALIPGHGGVLDRFDSLMFVSPLLYFYLDFVVF